MSKPHNIVTRPPLPYPRLQGNEFSYYMLITSSFMLNATTEPRQYTVGVLAIPDEYLSERSATEQSAAAFKHWQTTAVPLRSSHLHLTVMQ